MLHFPDLLAGRDTWTGTGDPVSQLFFNIQGITVHLFDSCLLRFLFIRANHESPAAGPSTGKCPEDISTSPGNIFQLSLLQTTS
jgi:hypothetical protein